MSDLARLFSLDPRSYTKDDLSAIVAAFRERRHQYNLTGTGKPAAKAPTVKQKEVLALTDKLNLDL